MVAVFRTGYLHNPYSLRGTWKKLSREDACVQVFLFSNSISG